MELGTGRSLTFGYDNLLRLQSETLEGIYQRRRNYGETTTANKETNRPNYFIYYKPDGTTVKLGYRYLYDAAGNIKQVYSREGENALALESSYEYDKFGQLIKADTGAGLETYTYDTAGNMLSRTVASTVKSFGYENTRWGDLLTSYRGQKLAYEGQSYNSSTNTVSGNPVSGNPVSYYNGRRWEMTWKNGKQLASATSSGRTVSYEYDKNGLRTSKTYNGTRYDYAYAGDKLVWQGWEGNEMYFFYDNTGAPIAFWYFPKGGARVTGYYFTNAQGDVTRIEDPNGNVLATYAYDAWGRNYSASGSMQNINPLRYRGYYQDAETNFYYLQSRYYDPSTARFINADSYASTGQGFLGYNMFAYCGNNPVSRVDASGSMHVRIDDFGGGGGLSVNGAGSKYVLQSQEKDSSVDKKNPPPPSTGYKEPKKGLNRNHNNGKVKNPNGPGWGWPSSDGGVWMPGDNMDGGAGWTIQYPNGNHKHVYPNGHTREHITIDWDPVIGGGIIVGSVLGLIWVAGNDATLVGIADDAVAIPPLLGAIQQGWSMIVG
ncbi:RHS repeat-associated core domain-containing protein [Neglectibacter caecimuris]|uniref:RHS repeat-associated core domain-containing protein n=1 Tax=Neglectibacter caecimuris TaxID=3093658 RepID=UPI002AC9D8E6|nr:RHS repeat-associated core domain-containing protein [Neglectibacter sp. M00184]